MKKRQIKTATGLIELLGQGQQTLVAGTHSSGARYEWEGGLPDSIPAVSLKVVDQMWEKLTQTYAKTSSTSTAATVPAKVSTDQTVETMTKISDEDWQTLLTALRFLLDKCSDNDLWSQIGYGLLSLQGSRPAERLWLDFSSKAAGAEAGAAEQWWSSHRDQQPRSDWRHILNLARQRGMQRVADVSAFEPVPEPALVDVVPPALPVDGRVTILLEEANFSGIIDQLESVLNPHVYTQGLSLVRTSEAHTVGAIRRTADAVMLIPTTKEWARKRFGQLCIFLRRLKSGDVVDTAPSAEHINTMLGLGSWNTLRPLDAIARAPFLREDQTICSIEGYDPASRVLYVPSCTYPPILESPTRDDALAALARLREPVNEFPWKEPASESTFLSHVLAEAARLALDRCPMYFYDAPSQGTGKSILQGMAARIVHGTEPALRPWVADEDEVRKSLYACLMAGDRSVWFDNIPDGVKVRSPTMAAFITSVVWKDRKLGESVTTGIPNKTVLCGSGNNVTPVSELARRSRSE